MNEVPPGNPAPPPLRKSPLNRGLLALLIIVTANWLWLSWNAREFRFLGFFVSFKSSSFVFPRGDTKLYFMDAVVRTKSNYSSVFGEEVEWTFWNTEERPVEFEFPEQVFIIEDSRGYTMTERLPEELRNQKFSVGPNEQKILRFKWDAMLVSNATRGKTPDWMRFYPLIKVGGQSVVYASPTGDNVRNGTK